MQVIVDGMLTHYERSGKGRVVLILPGWADTAQSWLKLQKTLISSYDVIVIDMPGFGGSQQPATSWGLTDFADFVKKFLDKLSIDEVYAVIGHSNGGAIAIRGLSSSQLMPKKLVLLASAGIRDRQTGKRTALRLLTKTGKLITAPLPGSVRRKLRSRLYRSVGSDMLAAEHMQETFKRIVAEDVQSEASDIQIPILLVYGSLDTDTPQAFGERYHRLITDSRLEIIPGAGHFLHTENPDEVSALTLEFLA